MDSNMKKILLLAMLGCALSMLWSEESNNRRAFKAAGLSVLIPGGGQAYNGKYIKTGAVLGIEGTFLGLAIYNYIQAEMYYDDYEISLLPSDLKKYNDHYDRQQNYAFWFGTTIFVSAVDAYVDAHLRDYIPQKENIHLKFEKSALLLSWRF